MPSISQEKLLDWFHFFTVWMSEDQNKGKSPTTHDFSQSALPKLSCARRVNKPLPNLVQTKLFSEKRSSFSSVLLRAYKTVQNEIFT